MEWFHIHIHVCDLMEEGIEGRGIWRNSKQILLSERRQQKTRVGDMDMGIYPIVTDLRSLL